MNERIEKLLKQSMTDKELLKQALNALEEIHPANVKPMAWEAAWHAAKVLRETS